MKIAKYVMIAAGLLAPLLSGYIRAQDNNASAKAAEYIKKEQEELQKMYNFSGQDSVDWSMALAYVDSAIALEPANPRHYEYKVSLLTGLRKFDLVKETIKTALVLDPDNADLLSYNGILYEKFGLADSAKIFHNRAILLFEGKTDSPDTMKNIWYTYKIAVQKCFIDKGEEGIEDLKKMLQKYPERHVYINKVISSLEIFDKKNFLEMFQNN